MKESTSRVGAEREGDPESEAGSRLRAVSTEPSAELKLRNREIPNRRPLPTVRGLAGAGSRDPRRRRDAGLRALLGAARVGGRGPSGEPGARLAPRGLRRAGPLEVTRRGRGAGPGAAAATAALAAAAAAAQSPQPQ